MRDETPSPPTCPGCGSTSTIRTLGSLLECSPPHACATIAALREAMREMEQLGGQAKVEWTQHPQFSPRSEYVAPLEGAVNGDRHYCDGYGPRKGWCGSASATDCTCAYSHRLHREGYAEGVAVATASIVARLRVTAREVAEGDAGMSAAEWLDSEADAIERGEREEKPSDASGLHRLMWGDDDE